MLTPDMRAAAIAAFNASTASVMADGVLSSHSQRIRSVEATRNYDFLLGCVSAMAGTLIVPPVEVRLFANEARTRDGLAILHNRHGDEAELTVVCRRFSWPRAALVDLQIWAAGCGLNTVVARLRASDWHVQDLARRAGFVFVQQAERGQFPDGEAISLWRLTLLDEDFVPRLFPLVRRDAGPFPSIVGAA